MPPLQKACTWCEQRARVELLGEQVYWVLHTRGVERMALMFKASKMLYYLDLARQD